MASRPAPTTSEGGSESASMTAATSDSPPVVSGGVGRQPTFEQRERDGTEVDVVDDRAEPSDRLAVG